MSVRSGRAHLVTHGPMYKHPISAAIRLLPAVCWVIAAVVCGWMSARLTLLLLTPDKWNVADKPWLELLFVGGFIGVAVYSVRMAYKEYKEALPALRADAPLWPTTPRPADAIQAPLRFPLPEAQKIQLQTAFATLVATGVLRNSEVSLEEILECAETLDDYSQVDCSEAYVIFNVLSALHSQRRQFRNLAFLADQVEIEDEHMLAVAHDFARLSGQTRQLQSVRLQAIGGGKVTPARRGEFPIDNAVMEVDVGGRRIGVTFVMYGKNLPFGLPEKLASIFLQPDDPRRFFSAYFDSCLAVTFITTDQAATLNLAFAHQPDCFELLEQRA
ncbi:MAG: hypothetical protein ABW171_15400 [Steroidobacter sp.]